MSRIHSTWANTSVGEGKIASLRFATAAPTTLPPIQDTVTLARDSASTKIPPEAKTPAGIAAYNQKLYRYYFTLATLAGIALTWIPSKKLENWIEGQFLGTASRATHDQIAKTPMPTPPTGVEVLHIPGQDKGVELAAWHLPAQPGKPTIVDSKGHGTRLSDRIFTMEQFRKAGYGFITFDYRGQGYSTGKPSYEGYCKDLDSIRNYLITEKNIPQEEQILFGSSLGSLIASEVAKTRPFKAVMLMSAPSSFQDVMLNVRKQWHIPKFLLRAEKLFQNRYNIAENARSIKSPLIVVQGEHDRLFPPQMAKKIYDAAEQAPSRKLIIIPGGHHAWLNEFCNSLPKTAI